MPEDDGAPHGGDASGQSRGWHRADEGVRVTAYMVAGPAVWGGLGWLADGWLGTDPWLVAVGVMTGAAGGFYLVWNTSKPSR